MIVINICLVCGTPGLRGIAFSIFSNYTSMWHRFLSTEIISLIVFCNTVEVFLKSICPKLEFCILFCLKVTKMSLWFRVPTKHSSARNATGCEKQTDLDMEDKLTKLLEMFPQRNRSELLEVTAFLLLIQFLTKAIFVGL